MPQTRCAAGDVSTFESQQPGVSAGAHLQRLKQYSHMRCCGKNHGQWLVSVRARTDRGLYAIIFKALTNGGIMISFWNDRTGAYNRNGLFIVASNACARMYCADE